MSVQKSAYQSYLAETYRRDSPDDPLNKLFGEIYAKATEEIGRIDLHDFGKTFFEKYKRGEETTLDKYSLTSDTSSLIMIKATSNLDASAIALNALIIEAGHFLPNRTESGIAGAIPAPIIPEPTLALEPAPKAPTPAPVAAPIVKKTTAKASKLGKHISDSQITTYASKLKKVLYSTYPKLAGVDYLSDDFICVPILQRAKQAKIAPSKESQFECHLAQLRKDINYKLQNTGSNKSLLLAELIQKISSQILPTYITSVVLEELLN
jgi:hypothetical protein